MDKNQEKMLKELRVKYQAVGGKQKPASVKVSHDEWADAMVEKELVEIRLAEHEIHARKLALLVYHINGVLALSKEVEGSVPPKPLEASNEGN